MNESWQACPGNQHQHVTPKPQRDAWGFVMDGEYRCEDCGARLTVYHRYCVAQPPQDVRQASESAGGDDERS